MEVKRNLETCNVTAALECCEGSVYEMEEPVGYL